MTHIELERRSLRVLLDLLAPPPVDKGMRGHKVQLESIRKLDLSLIEDVGHLLCPWPANLQQRVYEMHDTSHGSIKSLLSRILILKLLKLKTAIRVKLREKARDSRSRALAQRRAPPFDRISSVKEIARLMGLSWATVVKAINAGVIDCTITRNGVPASRNQIIVSVAASRRLRALQRCSIGVISAASRIDCSPAHIKLFVQLGELPCVQFTRHILSWRFRVKHLDRFLGRLNALAVPESIADSSLMSLAKINPRFAKGSPSPAWTRFVRDIFGGRVRLYQLSGEGTGFPALAVPIRDLPISHRGRCRSAPN